MQLKSRRIMYLLFKLSHTIFVFLNRLLALVCLVGVITAFKAFAEEIPSEWNRPRQEISSAWLIRQELVSVGDDKVGAKQLARIHEIQNQYGLTALPTVSLALIKEVLSHEPGLNWSQDLERLHYAQLLSPQLPTNNLLFCEIRYLLATPRSSFSKCVQGLKLKYNSNDGLLFLLANIFLQSFKAYLILCLCFVVFLLFNYLFPVTRFWARKLQYISPLGIISLVVLSGSLAWLFAGWPGLATFIILISWRHLKGEEKTVARVLFCLAGLIPFALYVPALQFNYKEGITSILEDPFQDFLLVRQSTKLKSWLERNPNDAQALFTLARIEKQTGRYAQARALYEKTLSLRPKWHKPLVNLATIDYIEGAKQNAISRLSQATTVAPNEILPFFNLSRILLEDTRLEEGQSALKKAKEIDSKFFALIDQKSNPRDVKQNLIDEALSKNDLFPRIFHFSPEVTLMRDALYKGLFPTLPFYALWILIASTFIVGVLMDKKLPPIKLPKLGGIKNIHSPKGALDIFDPAASFAIKKQFSFFSSLFSKIEGRWSSLVIPGSHFFFEGKFFSGFMNIFTCSILLLPVLEANGLLKSPYTVSDLNHFSSFALNIAIFAMIYVWLNFKAFKR